jgi:CTP synthase
MVWSGLSPDDRLVEFLELPDHPFFVATQAHPEFKSRPDRPHPLFAAFVRAALERAEGRLPRLPIAMDARDGLEADEVLEMGDPKAAV